MAYTVQDIFHILNEMAPVELQMDFDNSGFLVGHRDEIVRKVLVCLDITEEIVEEAIQVGANLILSHHPVIFRGVKQLTDRSSLGRLMLRMIENHISALCFHTNLDITDGGVNDVLIGLFGCSDVQSFNTDQCGRCGVLPNEMCLQDFLGKCKEVLNVPALHYIDAGRPVSRLAVVGGAGSDYIRDAFLAGCDTMITGDIKHHEFLDAREFGMNIIDAGHFYTENPVIYMLKDLLELKCPDLDITCTKQKESYIKAYY